MPVNTAVALLPATPTRLQFSTSSSDNDSDSSSSFQDTLQRASASQDSSSSSSTNDSSTQNTLAPAKKDASSKAGIAGDAKGSQKSKSKKGKAADEAADGTAATSQEDDSVPIEAAKDASDESQDKHGGAKKDKAQPTEVRAANASSLAAANAATEQRTAQAQDDPEQTDAANARATKAQASTGAANVKKATTEKDGEVDADGQHADAATDNQDASTDAAEDAGDLAATKFGVASGGKTRAGKKAAESAGDADKDPASTTTAAAAATAAVDATAAVADLISPESSGDSDKASSPVSALDPTGASVTAVGAAAPSNAKFSMSTAAADPADKALATSEAQFADANHSKIVTAVHGQLLPNGGTMQIRLDPAELGSLQINVQVKNGAMTATFETSNTDATRQLSHSLGDLRTVLEQAGVTVDKIHVQQSARPDRQNGGEDSSKQGQSEQNPQAKQEQQRRELLQRMWKKLSGGDPLDLTA